MRKYFVNYYKEFSNTYSLCYTDTAEEAEQAEKDGWERITRKEAIRLCAREKRRRKEDPAFSGFADTVVLPLGYDDYWENDRSMDLVDGYIVERRR